jgi:hypothetical protein
MAAAKNEKGVCYSHSFSDFCPLLFFCCKKVKKEECRNKFFGKVAVFRPGLPDGLFSNQKFQFGGP